MSDQGDPEPLGRLEPSVGAVSYETVPLIGQKRQHVDEEAETEDFGDDFEGFTDVR
jgi:hypothetical protein